MDILKIKLMIPDTGYDVKLFFTDFQAALRLEQNGR